MARALSLGLAAAAIVGLGGCGGGSGEQAGGSNQTAQSGEAKQAAGNRTIAAGLAPGSRFAAAARSAGLDSTLAGPGPYTVIVPDDAAFGKLPPAVVQTINRPENRAQLTGVLTYHILPGTVLAADIGKAIDNAKGKAVMATMGGGTLTATREGDRIILSDSAGGRATVTRADEQFSNGVVHHVDTVLMPSQGGRQAGPQGAQPPAQPGTPAP